MQTPLKKKIGQLSAHTGGKLGKFTRAARMVIFCVSEVQLTQEVRQVTCNVTVGRPTRAVRS